MRLLRSVSEASKALEINLGEYLKSGIRHANRGREKVKRKITSYRSSGERNEDGKEGESIGEGGVKVMRVGKQWVRERRGGERGWGGGGLERCCSR